MDVGPLLRTEGYRLTPQRRLVWDALRRAEGHLTAEELHGEVTRAAPDLNLASVYRTLRVLADLDLVREVHLGDGRGHWEVAHPDDAFHLVCRSCGGVEHHEGDLVENIRRHLAGGHGFTTERVELVVHGVCANCTGRLDSVTREVASRPEGR
jgi:Fur family ferric uptake transcriptional regulator